MFSLRFKVRVGATAVTGQVIARATHGSFATLRMTTGLSLSREALRYAPGDSSVVTLKLDPSCAAGVRCVVTLKLDPSCAAGVKCVVTLKLDPALRRGLTTPLSS